MTTRVVCAFAVVSIVLAIGAAKAPLSAQGISEMGGVYAMPKPMPNPNAMRNTLNKLYSSPTLPFSENSKVDASGKPIDPRVKVAVYGRQANALYEQAREKEKAGNTSEAIKLYGQSLAIRQSIWGDKDPNTAKTYVTLGDLYRKQKKLQDAESCFRRSLAIVNKRSGPGGFDSMTQITALADVLNDSGKYAEASSYYKQVLTLKERKLGADHADTTATRTKLIEALVNGGSLEDAESYLKTALALKEKAGDFGSQQCRNIMESYSRVLRGMGRAAEADSMDDRLKQVGNAQTRAEEHRGPGTSAETNQERPSAVSRETKEPNPQAPIPGGAETVNQSSSLRNPQGGSSSSPQP